LPGKSGDRPAGSDLQKQCMPAGDQSAEGAVEPDRFAELSGPEGWVTGLVRDDLP
jgi:hypothetical protein